MTAGARHAPLFLEDRPPLLADKEEVFIFQNKDTKAYVSIHVHLRHPAAGDVDIGRRLSSMIKVGFV
jgi:hypothetical protein